MYISGVHEKYPELNPCSYSCLIFDTSIKKKTYMDKRNSGQAELGELDTLKCERGSHALALQN